MSERHTELMATVGMVAAITFAYREGAKDIRPNVEKQLNIIDQTVTAATRFFGRVGAENVKKIADRIDAFNADKCLSRSKSILTYIDYALWLLESSMSGEKACGKISGMRGQVYLIRMVNALAALRHELAGNRNYEICSIAGIKAAERWMRNVENDQ